MASNVVVLKFGSSVLRTPGELPVAVAEVYRHYRAGSEVIAVASAFEGVTDGLLKQARAWGPEPDPATLAASLATGEILSATQLTFALHRAGLPARYLDPRDAGLTATGDPLNAELTGVRTDELTARLAAARILVIPGFFAGREKAGTALLGRGGSDLTALYLAQSLKGRCILLKDVDGLYEADPAKCAIPPKRLTRAHYAAAKQLGGELVQAKAIRFAQVHEQIVEVRAIGGTHGTVISGAPSVLCTDPVSPSLPVALLGLGTVGGGVYEYLTHFGSSFCIVGALVRTPTKYTERGIHAALLTTDPAEIFSRSPDIVIEALPERDPAHLLVAAALSSGAWVVTANKALIAGDWDEFRLHLSGSEPRLRYAAAVGGAAPMIEAIERVAARQRIVRLTGVLASMFFRVQRFVLVEPIFRNR